MCSWSGYDLPPIASPPASRRSEGRRRASDSTRPERCDLRRPRRQTGYRSLRPATGRSATDRTATHRRDRERPEVASRGDALAAGAREVTAPASLSALFNHSPNWGDHRRVQMTKMVICSQSVPVSALLHTLPNDEIVGAIGRTVRRSGSRFRPFRVQACQWRHRAITPRCGERGEDGTDAHVTAWCGR